jgi:hypothetical protein
MACKPLRINSGGQAGVDRAALDWAISNGVMNGGWCPKGRLAVDGPIAGHYDLRETESSGYSQRTKFNVRDSDATLILNLGALDGGTALTVNLCLACRKPFLVWQLGELEMPSDSLRRWLIETQPGVLNVAGPGEEKRPGIYKKTIALLNELFR